MKDKFFISDPHFGHENIINFKNSDDKLLRPFKSLEEMHQTIEDNWNTRVGVSDKVYILGDVVMNLKKCIDEKGVHILERLKGHKTLIKGNHDIFNSSDIYEKYFKAVHGVRVFPNDLVCTHVPVHPSCLERPSWPANVHGHLHNYEITKKVNVENGVVSTLITVPDRKYLNVSVERINYTPIEYSEVMEKLKGV